MGIVVIRGKRGNSWEVGNLGEREKTWEFVRNMKNCMNLWGNVRNCGHSYENVRKRDNSWDRSRGKRKPLLWDFHIFLHANVGIFIFT